MQCCMLLLPKWHDDGDDLQSPSVAASYVNCTMIKTKPCSAKNKEILQACDIVREIMNFMQKVFNKMICFHPHPIIWF